MTQRQSATRQALADRLMGEPVADQVLTLGCLEDGEHRLMSTSESTDTLVFVRRAKSDSAGGLTRTQEDAMSGARRVRQLESVQDKISQTVARVQREIAQATQEAWGSCSRMLASRMSFQEAPRSPQVWKRISTS